MKSTLFITLAILACSALSTTHEVTSTINGETNDISDYFQAWTCPNFDNSKYVTKARWDFTAIPRVGVSTHLRIYLTSPTTFYATTLAVTVKSMGIVMYRFNEDVEKKFPANIETYHSQWLPTEYTPGPMQLTGELEIFDSFGEKVICWSYWLKVLKKPGMMTQAYPEFTGSQ